MNHNVLIGLFFVALCVLTYMLVQERAERQACQIEAAEIRRQLDRVDMQIDLCHDIVHQLRTGRID